MRILFSVVFSLLTFAGRLFAQQNNTLTFQDTIFYTSKAKFTEKQILYNDSMNSYKIGYSVCISLKFMFEEISKQNGNLGVDYMGNTYSYDSYFYGGWQKKLKGGQIVDSNTQSAFIKTNEYPNTDDKSLFSDMRSVYKRLDSCKTKPIGVISAGEMPAIYIYAYPATIPIYKAPCFSVNNMRAHNTDVASGVEKFTKIDLQTYFLVNSHNLTVRPFLNRIHFDSAGKILFTDSVDPVHFEKIK